MTTVSPENTASPVKLISTSTVSASPSSPALSTASVTSSTTGTMMSPTVTAAAKTALTLSFKCDQFCYKGASEKELKKHTRLKHRISQLDGHSDSEVEESSKVTKEEPAKFEMGTDCYPKIYLIDSGVTPARKVFHSDLGNRHSFGMKLGGDTPSSRTLVMSFRGGFIK